MQTGIDCGVEPADKKAFGIAVYKHLRETHGEKDYYQVAEIEEAVVTLGYPEAWGVGRWLPSCCLQMQESILEVEICL